MQELMQMVLHLNEEEYKAVLLRFDDDRRLMLKYILQCSSECDIGDIEWNVFLQHRPLFERQNYVLKLELSGWSAKYKCLKFIQDATLFEFEVTFKHNPFYPFLALSVPYEGCLDLVTRLGIVVDPNVHKYAILVKALQEGKRRISFEDAEILFVKAGYKSDKDMTKVMPCGSNVLKGHALEHIDTSVTPPCMMEEYVKHKGEIVSKIREREKMSNQLAIPVAGFYDWKSDATEFIRLIDLLNKQVN